MSDYEMDSERRRQLRAAWIMDEVAGLDGIARLLVAPDLREEMEFSRPHVHRRTSPFPVSISDIRLAHQAGS